MSVSASRAGLTFGRPVAFWAGAAATSVGVVLHLPMFLGAEETGYVLAGMEVDATMILGMVLIVSGIALTAVGVFPRERPADEGPSIRIAPLDDAPIRRAHVGLMLVMAAAVTIDVMKPITLAFVVPGMSTEYGLKSPVNPDGTIPVAFLPLAGIAGTVLGSFLWGWMGDRIGRRSSMLLAGVLFIGTSVCGSMPNYTWNFVMCFIMGLGVGGMLPISFALMAETMPSRHRGWIMVLIGGDVIGAYIITSWLASWLVPTFGWRILWLIGLPTGVILILLNRWIPESPRFLLAMGRRAEATAVMARYGAKVVDEPEPEAEVHESEVRSRYRQLFAKPFTGLTTAITIFAIGVGIVSFGFQLWIPSNLQGLGFDDVTSTRILRDAAIIGFPLNFLVAWAYGVWSSKGTMIALAALTAASLIWFALVGDGVAGNRVLLYVLLVVPIWGISSITAILSAYSSEVYPTRIRSRGSGLAAGASKAAGVVMIGLVVLAVASPSITVTTLLGGVPMALAAAAVAAFGIETRRRRLEEITAEEFAVEAVSKP